jgi:hypothetical protein
MQLAAPEAFDLTREDERLRDEYGRTEFGQSCLMARRLVESGVRFVTVNMFETVFDERRPFFTEGNELLTGRGQSFIGRPSWFYSRRIGASPRGSATGDFVDAPINTTILAATKITGRLASGLSLGALGAVTPREYARTYDVVNDALARVAVEPPSSFAVARAQQEFGTQQSNVGASLTHVRRFVDERGQLNRILPRNAIAGGADWRLRYKQGMYELTGWVGGSRVDGDAAAIAAIQQSSAHYFQRPDQDHISFDSTRTSLSGWTASMRADKNAGRFTLGGIQLSARSTGFDINDAGQVAGRVWSYAPGAGAQCHRRHVQPPLFGTQRFGFGYNSFSSNFPFSSPFTFGSWSAFNTAAPAAVSVSRFSAQPNVAARTPGPIR